MHQYQRENKILFLFAITSFIKLGFSFILLDSSFIDQQIPINSQGWQLLEAPNCQSRNLTQSDIFGCSDQFNNTPVLQNQQSLIKNFLYRTAQIRIIYDIYYEMTGDTSVTSYPNPTVKLEIYNYSLQNSTTWQNKIQKICSTNMTSSVFDIQTIDFTLNSGAESFTVKITPTLNSSQQQVRIKNILIYGILCSPNCKTCNPLNSNQCYTCDYGAPNIQNQCNCPYDKFFSYEYGCVRECNRSNFLADTNYICQYNNQIIQNETYYDPQNTTTYTAVLPKYYYADSQSVTLQVNATIPALTNGNQSFLIGQFINQSQLYFPLQIYSYQSIRLRITLFFWNMLSSSKINFCINSYCQAQIQFQDSKLISTNLTIINITNNTDYNYSQVRVEMILQTLTQSEYLLNISGSMNFSQIIDNTSNQITTFLPTNLSEIPHFKLTDIWAFNNVTIDIIDSRSDHCLQYDSSSNYCIQCESNYYLYGSCYQVCPSYTIKNDSKCEYIYQSIPIPYQLISSSSTLQVSETYINTQYGYNQSQNTQTGELFSILQNRIVFGGFQVWNNSQFVRSQIIGPHYGISLYYSSIFIDGFDGIFQITLNNNQNDSKALTTQSQNLTGNDESETIFYNYSYFQHSISQLTITIQCQAKTKGYCALYDYNVFLHSCSSNCLTCISDKECTLCEYNVYNKYKIVNGSCQCLSALHRVYSGQCLCKSGYYPDPLNEGCLPRCGDQIIVENEECDDGNSIPFDGCYQCKYQCQDDCLICQYGICVMCKDGYTLKAEKCFIEQQEQKVIDQQFNGLIVFTNHVLCPNNCQFCFNDHCLQCINYWNLNPQTQQCEQICGNNFVSGNEQCDENFNSNIQIKGCLNCKCVYGYTFELNHCDTICGDKYQTLDEECDDGNSIQFDGCYQCILECKNCSLCKRGQCKQCLDGYYYDDQNLCLSTICGDGITAGEEMCDDGNDILLDGCDQCICEIGWLNQDQTCISICGDGIVVKGEQCDDGNIIQYDGCFQCQYDCDSKCTDCNNGICNACEIGFNIIDNICKNVCGDGILNILEEECDDNNNVPRDGCYNCKLEEQFYCIYDDDIKFKMCEKCSDFNCNNCSLNNQKIQQCNKCQSGYFLTQNNACQQCDKICIECENNPTQCITYNYDYYQVKDCNVTEGLIYNFKLRDCTSLCGDNIKVLNEQCDDGNTQNYDGCNSNCIIETGYLYNVEDQQLIKEPQFNIDVQSGQNNINEYVINSDSTQDILVCNQTTILIDGFQTQDYNFTINTYDLNCAIQINYFKTIESNNQIHFYLYYNSKFSKLRRLNQDYSREIIISPTRKVYVSEQEKAQGEAVAGAGQTMSTSVLIIGPLALIAGGISFFWTILDIMSWMNNFYFLNVNYPENVRQLFLYADWDNIIPMPQTQYFNNPTDPYYFQSPQKFEDKSIDPLFINNITMILLSLGALFIIYLLSIIIVQILNKFYIFENQYNKTNQITIFQLGNNEVKIENTKQYNIGKQNIKVSKIIQNLYNKCNECKECFFINFIKILQINYLDLILAITLQLNSQKQQDFLIIKINTIISIISIIISLFLFYQTYQISLIHKLLLNNNNFKKKYIVFYEGLSTQSQLQMSYSFTNQLRKTVFIVSTVTFYATPIIQTSICFLACLLNTALVLYKNPFESNEQLIVTFIPDISILIIVGSTILLAFQDQFQLFTESSIYKLGWLIAICIFISIGIQIICFAKDFFIKLWNNLIWIKNKITEIRKNNKLKQ